MIGFLLVGILLLSPIRAESCSIVPIGKINVTSYTYYKNSKNITASGKKVRSGHIALSPDIRKQFKPKFGDKIFLEGFGLFEYQDHMPNQWRRRADIFIADRSTCFRFGLKKGVVAYLVRREAMHQPEEEGGRTN